MTLVPKIVANGALLRSFVASFQLVFSLFQTPWKAGDPHSVVADIDNIVRVVRFPGWQNTKAGEREVQKALRKVIYVNYQIKDQDLFDRAFGYIRQYY